MRFRLKKDQGGIVHIIAILVIIVILLVAALAWASLSPGPSNDGAQNGQNNTNSAGNVTLQPGQAMAQVDVTIHSIHSIFDVHYSLYLNSVLVAEGTLTSGSSIFHTLTLFFPENETGQYSALISATSSGGFYGAKESQVVVTPVGGVIYQESLNI